MLNADNMCNSLLRPRRHIPAAGPARFFVSRNELRPVGEVAVLCICETQESRELFVTHCLRDINNALAFAKTTYREGINYVGARELPGRTPCCRGRCAAVRVPQVNKCFFVFAIYTDATAAAGRHNLTAV